MNYSIGKQLDINELNHYLDDPRFSESLEQVIFEIANAERKHPVFPEDLQEQISILAEEVCEAAECANDFYSIGGGCFPFEKEISMNYRKEILHVAAVAFRILMATHQEDKPL